MIRRSAPLLGLALSLAGCLGETPADCTSQSDCAGMQACVSGVCVRPAAAATPDQGGVGGQGGAGGEGGVGGEGGAGGVVPGPCGPGALDLDLDPANGCEAGCTVDPDSVVELTTMPVSHVSVNRLRHVAFVHRDDPERINVWGTEREHTLVTPDPIDELALVASGDTRAVALTFLQPRLRPKYAMVLSENFSPALVDRPSLLEGPAWATASIHLITGAAQPSLNTVSVFLFARAFTNTRSAGLNAFTAFGNDAARFTLLGSDADRPEEPDDLLSMAPVAPLARSDASGNLDMVLLLDGVDRMGRAFTTVFPIRAVAGEPEPTLEAFQDVPGEITAHVATSRLYVAQRGGGLTAWARTPEGGLQDEQRTLQELNTLSGLLYSPTTDVHYVIGLFDGQPSVVAVDAQGRNGRETLGDTVPTVERLWVSRNDTGPATVVWVPPNGRGLKQATLTCR